MSQFHPDAQWVVAGKERNKVVTGLANRDCCESDVQGGTGQVQMGLKHIDHCSFVRQSILHRFLDKL